MELPCFSVLGVYSRAAVAVDSIPCSQTGRSYFKITYSALVLKEYFNQIRQIQRGQYYSVTKTVSLNPVVLEFDSGYIVDLSLTEVHFKYQKRGDFLSSASGEFLLEEIWVKIS